MTFFIKKFVENDIGYIRDMFLRCKKDLRILDVRSMSFRGHEDVAQERIAVSEYGYGLYKIAVQHLAFILQDDVDPIGFFEGNLCVYTPLEVGDTAMLEVEIDSVFVLPQYRGQYLWRNYLPQTLGPVLDQHLLPGMHTRAIGSAISKEGFSFITYVDTFLRETSLGLNHRDSYAGPEL